MNRFITESELLPDDIRQVLQDNDQIFVSGRPTHHYTADGKEFRYDDCSEVIDLPLMVSQALIASVPLIGHRHLDSLYIGTYPVIFGDNPDTFDGYRFALINDLNVVISPRTEV